MFQYLSSAALGGGNHFRLSVNYPVRWGDSVSPGARGQVEAKKCVQELNPDFSFKKEVGGCSMG